MLTVDDDSAVSRAVARDLRRHYGEVHRDRAGTLIDNRAGVTEDVGCGQMLVPTTWPFRC